ncbi:MAG: helix-turn-helix transcriptional regulator [Pseudomonadota bacterium]
MDSHRSEDRNTVSLRAPGMDAFRAVPPRTAAPLPQRRKRAMAEEVERLIARGTADQPSVAALLGMSVATLRRRLSDEGTSFRALRTKVLSVRALELLATDAVMGVVAAELGFSDVRSFSRAFKSWTGETPHTARRRLQS